MKINFKKIVSIAIGFVILVSLAYVFLVPKLYIGNIFFGDVPALYQPTIAHFFYNQALFFDTKGGIPPIFIHYQLSRLHFIDGELEEALEEIERELAFHPDNMRTYYIKGLTLGYMHREREAIEAFAKFIEYKPESWAARNDKAWLHFRIGDIQGALETIRPATVTDPHNPWVMNTYGVLLMNQGSQEEAKEAFTRALETAEKMTGEDWGKAYPGNDPKIYDTGWSAMVTSIKNNLELLQK